MPCKNQISPDAWRHLNFTEEKLKKRITSQMNLRKKDNLSIYKKGKKMLQETGNIQ